MIALWNRKWLVTAVMQAEKIPPTVEKTNLSLGLLFLEEPIVLKISCCHAVSIALFLIKAP